MKRELQELLADLSWHRDHCKWLAERSANQEIALLNRGAAAGFQECIDRLLHLGYSLGCFQSEQSDDVGGPNRLGAEGARMTPETASPWAKMPGQ